MSSTDLLFKILNPLMTAFLKSPLHSLVSGKIMLITFNGRDSGNEYSTPVSYFQEGDVVYCFTHASWWINLRHQPVVRMRIRGKDYVGEAEVVATDNEQKAGSLTKMLRAVPNDAGFYKVSIDESGEPNADEIHRAVNDVVMIRILIREPHPHIEFRATSG